MDPPVVKLTVPSAAVNYVEEDASRTPNTIIERADDR